MIKFYYNKNIYTSYYQLLIDLIEYSDEDSINDIAFPLDYEIYICSHLNTRFPDIKLNVEDVRKILAKELALKTITLKDEKGLESAHSANL